MSNDHHREPAATRRASFEVGLLALLLCAGCPLDRDDNGRGPMPDTGCPDTGDCGGPDTEPLMSAEDWPFPEVWDEFEACSWLFVEGAHDDLVALLQLDLPDAEYNAAEDFSLSGVMAGHDMLILIENTGPGTGGSTLQYTGCSGRTQNLVGGNWIAMEVPYEISGAYHPEGTTDACLHTACYQLSITLYDLPMHYVGYSSFDWDYGDFYLEQFGPFEVTVEAPG
jgi:hypothetical protein